MKKQVFIFLFVLVSFFACEIPKKNSDTVSTETDTEKIEEPTTNSTSGKTEEKVNNSAKNEEVNRDKVSFSELSIKKTFGNCQGDNPCAKVNVTYPKYNGGNEKFVTKQIDKRLAKSLSSFLPEGKGKNSNAEKVAELIMKDYESFTKEYKDASERWEIELNAEISNIYGNVLSLAISENSYTGGAHGNTSLNYFNYNWKNKKELNPKDFIEDLKKLSKIAETKFRKQNGFSASTDLNEKGYFFEKGKFELNQNIGFTPKGLEIYFNSYEIAPYAMGPTSILIPYSEISDILKD